MIVGPFGRWLDSAGGLGAGVYSAHHGVRQLGCLTQSTARQPKGTRHRGGAGRLKLDDSWRLLMRFDSPPNFKPIIFRIELQCGKCSTNLSGLSGESLRRGQTCFPEPTLLRYTSRTVAQRSWQHRVRLILGLPLSSTPLLLALLLTSVGCAGNVRLSGPAAAGPAITEASVRAPHGVPRQRCAERPRQRDARRSGLPPRTSPPKCASGDWNHSATPEASSRPLISSPPTSSPHQC